MASYATTEQLRTYLPQVTDTSENESLLDDCLTRATGIVRDALRSLLADPFFDYAAYGSASTKIVRGYGAEYLTLPAHQAGSVTLVEYMSGQNPATYATVADEYLQENGQLYRAYGWGGTPRYRVTAVWGYGAVPASIEELTLELAVSIWRSKDRGGYTDTIGVEGSGSLRFTAGLTNLQQQVLENIRNQLIQVAV